MATLFDYYANKEGIFKKLFSDFNSCRRCELWKELKACNNNHPVWPNGSLNAEIAIIGTAPGRASAKKPVTADESFATGSGKYLDEALDNAGLTRDDVWITNIIKCNTPKNGLLKLHQAKACSKWLRIELDLIKPKKIILLGRKTFLFFGVLFARKYEDKVYKTIHPAAIFRNYNFKTKFLNDIKKFVEA
ncbi:MAG: uracil-DNA glycosylase [Candidatus Odinarchaeia archaeon]